MTTVTAPSQVKRRFDTLCWAFVLAGLLCLGASIPATFAMVSVAHNTAGAIMLMLVLELMAFFSLLAVLWVPNWKQEFERIAWVLLSITTLANYAAGWDFVWSRPSEELSTFWRGMRDYWILSPSFNPFTIVLVAVLSALVPYGIKFFLGLAVKRYRENEMEHSPEAVAARMVEPMQVQILAVRSMQEHLLQMTSAFGNPLVLPAASQPSLGLSNRGGDSADWLSQEVQQADDMRLRAESNEKAAVLEAVALKQELAEAQSRLDSAEVALEEKARLLAQRYEIPEVHKPQPDELFEELLGSVKQGGAILRNEAPPAATHSAAKKSAPPVVSGSGCETCGGPLSASDLGVAARSKTKARLCKICRTTPSA